MKSQKLVVLNNRSHLTNAEKKQKLESAVEVENKPELIVAPKYLNKKMRDNFYSLANELQKAKIFKHLDVEILGKHCFNIFVYENICKKLIKLDVESEEFDKLAKRQKLYFQLTQATAQELGIGFYSRSKFQLPIDTKKKESKFDRLRSSAK